MRYICIVLLYTSLILINSHFALATNTLEVTENSVIATATPAKATETPVVATVIPKERKEVTNHTSPPLSPYERKSLWATWAYNFLTFFLLCFVIYESIIKPKIPNIECDVIRFHRGGVNSTGYTFPHQDLLIKNHGNELKNIQITSEPDELNWNWYDEGVGKKRCDAKTSDVFQNEIPRLASNQTLQIYWCNAAENEEIFQKPFTIHIEFDNPLPLLFIFKKRLRKSFHFDYSVYKGVISGIAKKYDIHDVAKELSYIRESVKRFDTWLQKYEYRRICQAEQDTDSQGPPEDILFSKRDTTTEPVDPND